MKALDKLRQALTPNPNDGLLTQDVDALPTTEADAAQDAAAQPEPTSATPATLDLTEAADRKPTTYHANQDFSFANLTAAGIGNRVGPPTVPPAIDPSKRPTTLVFEDTNPGAPPTTRAEASTREPAPTTFIIEDPKPEAPKDAEGRSPVTAHTGGKPLDVHSVSYGLKIRPGAPEKAHPGISIPKAFQNLKER